MQFVKIINDSNGLLGKLPLVVEFYSTKRSRVGWKFKGIKVSIFYFFKNIAINRNLVTVIVLHLKLQVG